MVSHPDGSNPHDLYFRALRELEPSVAVALLEESAVRLADDPFVQNDLAVAYLERDRKEDRPLDLILALAAVDRALRIEPEFAEARFNRASILTRLHLRRQARSAWQDCLGLGPRFAAEARRQFRTLSAPSLAEQWSKERSRLDEAISKADQATVRGIVSHFRNLARVTVEEETLSGWGEALTVGDTATAVKRLAWAKSVGSALVETTGDAMAHDAVEVIERAIRAGGRSDRLRVLAAGHRAFGRGLLLYRGQAGSAGRVALLDSARLLAAAGSPFAFWASFYAATDSHFSDPIGARGAFLGLQAETDPKRYPVLAGLTAWMLGTVESNLNHPERALIAFIMARERLAPTSAPETSGFVHTLLAEAYDRLGEVMPAWRERVAALAAAAEGGDPRRSHATLHEAIEAAQRIAPAAALEIQNELLANDRSWSNAGALAEAYLLAGRTLTLLGRHNEALSAFHSAQAAASSLGQGAQSDRIAIEVALAEGEVMAGSNPSQALASLTVALSGAKRQNYFFQVTRLLTERANVLLQFGDQKAADADLQRAIAEHERVRADLDQGQLRVSYFEGAQVTFDAMIRLQVEVRHATRTGFEFAERARARQLLDLVEIHSMAIFPRPLGAAEILARMPANTILIEYVVLPERVFAWIVRQAGIEFVDIPITEAILRSKIQALHSAIARRASEPELHRASAEVHEALLRPLLPLLPRGASLVIIPDRFLIEIPFAALYDLETGRYLVEDHVLAIAPSATLYLTTLSRARHFDALPWTALVVGDPAFDLDLHPSLPRLMEAAREATEVAALYPGAELLLAEAATRDAFLQSVRTHRVLHFGGHALLAPNSPRTNRLLLARGSVSDSLTTEEIAALRLPDTEVVVLSSCRTLPGGNERESVNGLAAAFLAAGATVVVSSLWEADDWTVRPLMVGFHDRLRRGQPPASALRDAQLVLLRGPSAVLRSPAVWGGFEAIGGAIDD